MRVCPECSLKTEEETCPKDGFRTIDEASLQVPAADALIGTTVADRYRIERRLGRGGFGSVYLAKHVETGGDLAVKFLRGDLIDHPNIIKRFYVEAQNTHRLRHPNTVRVHDFGRTPEGALYLVLEYVEGYPLETAMAGGKQISVRRTLRIIAQVLKSLGEAHQLRLVHRDIKPANIMLIDQFGEPDFVKVLDFGIARSLDSTGITSKSLVGTPRYMAPEQWLALPIDARLDLYAVGCLMVEMLTGRFPYPLQSGETNPMTLMHCHVQGVMIHPNRHLDTPLSEPLVDLLTALLSKSPDGRPATAGDVLGQLALTPEGQASGMSPMAAPVPPPALPKDGVQATVETVPEFMKKPANDAPVVLDTSDAIPLPDPVDPIPRPHSPFRLWLAGALVATAVFSVILVMMRQEPAALPPTWLSGPTAAETARGIRSRTPTETKARPSATVTPPPPARAASLPPTPPASEKVAPREKISSAHRLIVDALVVAKRLGQKAQNAGSTKPTFATLVITSTPSAAEVFNPQGKSLGKTPLTLKRPPYEADDVVKVRLAGYFEQTKTLRFPSRGETKRTPVTLERQPTLQVKSAPPGARVAIAELGLRVGTTPATFKVTRAMHKHLRSGKVLTAVFKKPGRQTIRRSFRSADFKEHALTLKVTLKTKKRARRSRRDKSALPPLRTP